MASKGHKTSGSIYDRVTILEQELDASYEAVKELANTLSAHKHHIEVLETAAIALSAMPKWICEMVVGLPEGGEPKESYDEFAVKYVTKHMEAMRRKEHDA